MTNTMTWNFPLPRTHTGIILGNTVSGLMIWGNGSQLNITLGSWESIIINRLTVCLVLLN